MTQPSRRSFFLALTAVALVAGATSLVLLPYPTAAGSASRGKGLAQSGRAQRPASLPAAASPTPAVSLDPVRTAAPGGVAGKAQPSEPPPSPGGLYPYPVDAGPAVADGSLILTPTAAPAGSDVMVTASTDGWAPGQRILVFLGERFELTLSGPGAQAEFAVPQGALGPAGVIVSGFQFPGNDLAAPVDGFGTANLRAGA